MNLRESEHNDTIVFGPFCLSVKGRRLERDGAEVKVGSRALDILIALSERAGEVVSKEELAARVWPDTAVEESGLRVQIGTLRKVLSEGNAEFRCITNVPGRGYCFVAPLLHERASRAPAMEQRRHALPSRLERIVGRDEAIREVCEQILATRFVSIIGPGGMGKTTVAVAVAHTLLGGFEGDVCFVDLGALTRTEQVATSVALAVGLGLSGGDAASSLIAFLQDRRTLLVLDSCEHVMATLAPLAERLFVGAPQVHIVVTSREPLRVEGECIYRMMPLDSPPEGSVVTAADALTFPSVQLFAQRARAGGARLTLTDADAPVVAQICRRLDGIALAIEIAAGRVEAYGIRGTASLLEDRLKLLWHGRRTSPPRHRTLGSMLDWSHSLLSVLERKTLRRLSIFVGLFSLDAFTAVMSDDEGDGDDLIETLSMLIEKSLVSVDITGAAVKYRLLDTTRAYAHEKLDDIGERNMIARRLACYLCRTLERDGGSMDDLGNVRASLAWSFSNAGDAALATTLAAAAGRIFTRLSMLIECQHWAECAISALRATERGTRREMVLQATLGVCSMFTRGNSQKVQASLTRALSIADELDEPEQQIRMLGALFIFLTRVGEFREALRIAERAEVVVERLSDPHARAVSDWMIGTSQHLLGQQVGAEKHCNSALTPPPMSTRMANIGVGFSHRILALVSLCRSLWLLGRAEDAMKVGRTTIGVAREIGQPVTLAIALIWTSSVFLWSGDLVGASELIEQLIALARKHSLGPYMTSGLGLRGELYVKRGAVREGLDLLRPALDALRFERHEILHVVFATAIAEGLATEARFDDALRMLDEAIAGRVAKNGEAFDLPEMLRVKGQVLATMPLPRTAEAELCLLQALEISRRQRALGWELRAAMSLARLRSACGRGGDARTLLRACYDQFTEGFETADLRAARQLISELPKLPD
jgi:predicted ATPase/DNA-binding winged helix-turn-helix (wHTH) protein